MKMSEILSPEARERLLGVKAEIKPAKKAKAKKAKRAKAEPVEASAVVVDDDRFPVTTINGVEVDLRGDALHETECVDCHEGVLVEILPDRLTAEQQQELVAKPRTVRCLPCAKAYLHDKPDAKVVYRKPQVARHQPRVTDGRDHPVEVTPKKENPMDLSQFSKAELLALIEHAESILLTERMNDLAPNIKAALAEREEAAAVDKALFEADRESRMGVVLPGFTIKTSAGAIEVPALDLSAVTDMSEIVASKARSPYNKALYRLGESILAGGNPDEIATKANLATYAAVSEVHERLFAMSTAPKALVTEAKADVLVAEVKAEAKAKVGTFTKGQIKRYAKATGQSKAEARAELEAIA